MNAMSRNFAHHVDGTWEAQGHQMGPPQLSRFSRQIILERFGPEAQDKLIKASVLVVGAGGLGCPAILYLAAMGVGRLGIVDRDAVELSNLHRQIAHTEADVGVHKADSAAASARAINSSCIVEAHREGISPSNAVRLVSQYDVVVDATDNVPSRYLLSDACIAAKRPLVSGAAIGTDGQLTVYNFKDAPCYRCLHPDPPAPEHCSRCSEQGVLGAVPGAIGTLQAIEAVKVLCGVGSPLSGRLLVFDALDGMFRTVKLRSRDPACIACGEGREWDERRVSEFDYRSFSGQDMEEGRSPPVRLLGDDARVSVSQLSDALRRRGAAPDEGAGQEAPPTACPVPAGDAIGPSLAAAAASGVPLVLDVRPACQFRTAHLRGTVCAPLSSLRRSSKALAEHAADPRKAGVEIVTLCRRGNDSQLAAQVLSQAGFTNVKDVVGGLEAWRAEVDSSFPDF